MYREMDKKLSDKSRVHLIYIYIFNYLWKSIHKWTDHKFWC